MKCTSPVFTYLLVIFVISVCFVSSLYGQNSEQYKVTHIDNITQNDITSVHKDSEGFMWFGTLDGLVKYDGTASKVYRIKQGENSISSNMIIDIDEDSLGNIWIATFGKGLCKFNPVSEKFTSYFTGADSEYRIISDDISCIYVDGNILWVGNNRGLSRITLNSEMSQVLSKSMIPFDILSNSTSGVSVKTIFKDKDGDLWVGLNSHIVRITTPYAPVESIEFTNRPGNVNSFCYSDSLFIAGGQFIQIIHKKEGANFDITRVRYNQGSSLIYHKGYLWGGDTKGIVRIRKVYWNWWEEDGLLTSESTNNALKSDLVTSIVADNYGQIWVGTRGGGVHIITPEHEYFPHYYHTSAERSVSNSMIRSAFEDSEETLWIGTEGGGVNYLKGDDKYNYSNGFGKTDILNYPKEHNRAYAIAEQFTPLSKKQKRLIWVGTSFPVFLQAIDPATMSYIDNSKFTNDIGFVFTIEVQNDTTLWLGTYGEGLLRIVTDSDGRIIRKYRYTPDDKLSSQVSSYVIRSILYDSKGNLWISTDKGLNRLTEDQVNKAEPEFITYRFGKTKDRPYNDYLLQVFESTSGKIWLGSIGNGLISIENEISVDSLEFSVLTTADGLSNNSIKAIQEDNKGNLWLSSNKGLSKYNPATGDIVNYDTEDGLQGNEFVDLVSCYRKNGQLFFGGNNGFNVFYPETLTKDTAPTRLYFTDFYILNELVEPGKKYNGKVVLDKSIQHTNEIVLKHNHSSFSISFTGVHYKSPQKNKYKYMLEGFDTKWINTTADYRTAKYTNIPSGKYTFKVTGANCDNVWTTEPISIIIRVKPHPLLSTLAYIFYSVVLAFIILSIVRTARIISNRKKEALIAGIEKKNAEEMAQMKLRFFTNISHEFRTPLTLISIPLEKLMKAAEKLTVSEQKELGIIKQNTDVMLRLVNQILDFRKMDQEKMKLETETTDIIAFAANIFDSFSSLADKKNINYEFIHSDKEIVFSFDIHKIEKVIYNLLSNAFKFTPDNGNIKLTLNADKEDNILVITVSDSGIGINENDRQKIFERYYQSDNKKRSDITGTGIGLSLSNGLVELHGGEITVESKVGEGSVFTVILPMKQGVQINIEKKQEVTHNQGISNSNKYTYDTAPTNDIITQFKEQKNDYKLLVVEDNTELRETIAGIFSDTFKVIQAENGLEGYNKCSENEPDLIISDIMMPKMDGIELLTKIKNDENVSHIPVILLTAKNSVEDRIEGHLSGADAYISKPFNADELFAKAVAVIKGREKLKAKFQKEIEINPMVISNSPADVKFMDKILAIIEENLSEPEFNVDKLSDAYGVSRIHLNRKIKALTGETPIQFLRNIKMKYAAEFLKQGSLNVSEVAWEVGFSDIGTFRKRFKEQFGVSPSEFAKTDNS